MKKIHEGISALIKKMKDINLVFLILLITVLFIPINMVVFYGIAVVLVFIFAYELYLINTKLSELTLSIVELMAQKNNTLDILTQQDEKEIKEIVEPLQVKTEEKTEEKTAKNNNKNINNKVDYFTDYESLIKAEAEAEDENNI